MFRYVFVLLLVNASYRSLGNPINPNSPDTLGNSLTALVGHCENVFLLNQIKSKLIYCSDDSSPHGEKQLQCLIFYDINRQLCAAVGSSKLALTEDYTAKINEEQDVNALCLIAKDWVFSNLTEFSRYKPAVDKIFKHLVTCGKICGVEDFTSDDANYFCKYFKWGTEMLKHQVDITSTQENTANIAQLPPITGNTDNKSMSTPNNSDLQDVQIKNTTRSIEPKLNTTINSFDKAEDVAKPDILKTELTSFTGTQNSQPLEPSSQFNAAVPEKPENADTNVDNVEDTGVMPDNVLPANDQSSKSFKDASKVDTIQEANKADTPEATQNKPEDPLKTDVDNEIQLLNKESEHKEPVLENPKVKQPGDDDYQDPEEGKEGLSDIQGDDDGDEPMLGELENKPQESKSVKKTDTNENSFIGEREYYPNPVQNEFADDDDHFFPFFLTAVILVILLYVLYHNKNKVSKVFFGLMIEGRQGTRRRNSRGHAYRRLDTLEQAISANTAAPPSKIIY